MLGDEASGAWLGHQALRRAVLAAEGLLPQTDLMQDLVQEHGGTLHGLLSFVNAAQPHDYAALAPRVIEAAQSADLHGLALMREGAQYLGSCLQELKIMEHDRLCLIGGVGPYYTPYLDVEVTPLIQPPKGGALDGAVHLARQLL